MSAPSTFDAPMRTRLPPNVTRETNRHGKAVYYYRAAAKAGDHAAQNNLGELYELGKGVTQDASLAFSWYARAAEAGFPPSQLNLARLYAEGSGVAIPDLVGPNARGGDQTLHRDRRIRAGRVRRPVAGIDLDPQADHAAPGAADPGRPRCGGVRRAARGRPHWPRRPAFPQ